MQLLRRTFVIAAAIAAAASPGFAAAPAAPANASAQSEYLRQISLSLKGSLDTVVKSTSTDIGTTVVANTAKALTAALPTRRGFSIQNQTAGDCYVSGQTTATADYHSLKVAAGAFYETPGTHVGTGALSVICAAAGGIYARQW